MATLAIAEIGVSLHLLRKRVQRNWLVYGDHRLGSLAFQGAREQTDGAHPGILRGGGVVYFGAGVVEKSVIGVGINTHFGVDAVLLERLLEISDFLGIDPAVFPSGDE